jgi:hypothetical protein
MNSDDETRLAELADAEQHPARPLSSAGAAYRGSEAAEVGTALLLSAFGTQRAIASEIRSGRPQIRAPKKPVTEPMIRTRISMIDDERLDALQKRTQKTRSELVREAIELLLLSYDASYEVPRTGPIEIPSEGDADSQYR